MAVEIIECEQGSEEWFLHRMGIPTASEFANVMSAPSGRGLMPGRTRYLYQLAGEIISGAPSESYQNAAMKRGKDMESTLRSAWSVLTDRPTRQVGFVRNDGLITGRVVGCSPDSLIGEDGLLELKSQQPDLLIHLLKAGGFPREHLAQCQGGLWVTERKYFELAIGYTGLPMYRATVKRDDAYIEHQLKPAVARFCDELDELVVWLRNYKGT